MSIVTGISSMEALVHKINLGVNEVFLGFIDVEWVVKYGFLISPNRRWGRYANIFNIDELKRIIAYAHLNHVNVSLALNAHRYCNAQLVIIKKILSKTVACGIDNIIVSDFTLIDVIRTHYPGISVHISTGGLTFNEESIKFYEALGVTRVIFPRSLRISEIINLAKSHPKLEYEVFMNGARCANIDGLCNFEHAILDFNNNEIINYPMCGLKYDIHVYDFEKKQVINEGIKIKYIENKQMFNTYPIACSACYIYELIKSGICYFKIPARSMISVNDMNKIDKETDFIINCLKSVDDFESSFEYKNHVRAIYEKYFSYKCYEGCIRCYTGR